MKRGYLKFMRSSKPSTHNPHKGKPSKQEFGRAKTSIKLEQYSKLSLGPTAQVYLFSFITCSGIVSISRVNGSSWDAIRYQSSTRGTGHKQIWKQSLRWDIYETSNVI
mmetsp:Transcript_15320/g.32846  ORF Transcript_15320/g.32846 Transcript_15320/m.32846 type:complete len:108 (+) Transcript_15320:122-445(+)